MALGRHLAEGRTAEVFAWGEGQVIKLFRPWCPPDWIDYEARIAQAVVQTGVGAPAYGGIVEIDDRRGILYQRIDGSTLVDRLLSGPESLVSAAYLLAELHVQMHARTAPTLPSLRRKLESRIASTPLLAPPTRDRILTALAELPDGESLCHGDFHPGNVLCAEDGPVIIDWTDASHGHRLADVARTSYLIRMTGPPVGFDPDLIDSARTAFYDAYLHRYCELTGVTPAEIDRWMLPIAAARLSEDVTEENERIVELVDQMLNRP